MVVSSSPYENMIGDAWSDADDRMAVEATCIAYSC
jgi:hypothetical protein